MPSKYIPAVLPKRACRYCQQEFQPVRRENTVCTEKHCQLKRNRDKLRAFKKRQPPRVKHVPSVFCRICLTTQAKKVCSRACSLIDGMISYRQYWKPIAHVNEPITKRCLECDKEFTLRRYRHRGYCSHKCGALATGREAKHRRRVRLRGTTTANERVEKRNIYARDQWMCQLCHKPVSPNHKYPHPMSASIDHIIPVSLGGHHAPINVQLAHWICNSKRGATGPAQLRLLA